MREQYLHFGVLGPIGIPYPIGSLGEMKMMAVILENDERLFDEIWNKD